MSISIEQSSGHRLAEARRISVHGLPGVGSYTLVINLHLSVTAPATDTYLSNLSIRVDWGDNQQRMIGTGVPDQAQPIRLSQYSNEAACQATQIASVSPYAVVKMEISRILTTEAPSTQRKMSYVLIAEMQKRREKTNIKTPRLSVSVVRGK